METCVPPQLGLILTILLPLVLQNTGAIGQDSCGPQIRNNLIGLIESPTHMISDNDMVYSPNQNCTWRIQPAYAYVNRIELYLSRMNLYRKDDLCEDADVLQYVYKEYIGIPLVLCDYPVSNPIILNTSGVTLRFTSRNISDEAKIQANETEGFSLRYRAVCDEGHIFEVNDISEPLKPPPRNSPLMNCTYRWKLKEQPSKSTKDMFLITATESTNIWKIQGLQLPPIGVCLPFDNTTNITVSYFPSLGLQPRETEMNFQKVTEDECGCLLKTRQCENSGQCVQKGKRFVCQCKFPFLGDMCETPIDDQHCYGKRDSYLESGIEWSHTRMGETDIRPCPNATGNATRPCLNVNRVARWGQPVLSGCVSKLFSDIYNQAQILYHAVQVDENSVVNLTSALTVATSMEREKKLFAGDLNAAVSTLGTLAEVVAKTTVEKHGLTNIAQGFGDVVGNLVDPETSAVWRFTRKGYLENRITSLLESVEVLSSNVASKASEIISRRRRSVTHISNSPDSISVTSSNLDFQVKLIDRVKGLVQRTFSGQENGSEIDLPEIVFRIAVQRTSDAFLYLYNAKFTSISELMDKTKKLQSNMDNDSFPVVNSDILSSKVLNVNPQTFTSLSDPVRLVFHLQNASLAHRLQQKCVFLNMTATTEKDRWLTQGCSKSDSESNENYTESIDELNSKILTYLSYAGGALSVLGCVLSIIVFEFFRLKNERIRIHEQLAVTIILVQSFFLVGIDRTENRSVCMAMAICLHYFLMAMFCWMLVEGVHLYFLLVRVFKYGSHMKKYIAIGWGIPLVIVGISAGIFHDDYGTGSVCWLTHEVLVIAFVPAVGLVIVINTVVLLIVMKIMVTSLSKGSKASSEDKSSVRIGLKAAAVLLPLLGLTWTFGFLSITSDETLIFTYLFTLFNSTQGVFFFVFHCLLSVDVQNAYDRRSRRLSHLKLTESSISKLHSRRISESGELSKHSTLISEIASTLERRRSHTNSYSSIGRPQSVTFDDDVFLTQDGPVTRNSLRSHRSSVHSNNNRNSFHDIVRSPPMPAHDKVQDYRNNIWNNSSRSRGSVSSDGYQFYYGKDKKQLNENGIYDFDKNQLYATVNK